MNLRSSASERFRRFLAPIAVILASLTAKLEGFRWPSGESRQRQQYWHHGYRIQSRFEGLPPLAVADLLGKHVIPATHSTIDRTTPPVLVPPYRRLAATAPP